MSTSSCDDKTIDRASILQRDAADSLGGFRDAIDLPDGLIYLDGNSRGALPKRVLHDQWRTGLIRSWNDAGWFSLPRRLGDKIAQLVGAGAGEVVVTDSTSVNLFKLLNAALQSRLERLAIVSKRGNFPTDRYKAECLAPMRGRPGNRSVAGHLAYAIGKRPCVHPRLRPCRRGADSSRQRLHLAFSLWSRRALGRAALLRFAGADGHRHQPRRNDCGQR